MGCLASKEAQAPSSAPAPATTTTAGKQAAGAHHQGPDSHATQATANGDHKQQRASPRGGADVVAAAAAQPASPNGAKQAPPSPGGEKIVTPSDVKLDTAGPAPLNGHHAQPPASPTAPTTPPAAPPSPPTAAQAPV